MERDWTYFALVALGCVLLWLLHRRRHGGRRRGLLPIVAAILAIVGLLAVMASR